MSCNFRSCWCGATKLGINSSGQNYYELKWFCSRMAEIKVNTYLEIGSREGFSLHMLIRMLVLKEGGLSIAVDLPDKNWYGEDSKIKRQSTGECLDQVRLSLIGDHFNVIVLKNDSQKVETLHRVEHYLQGRPVDVLLIDADHTYKGVSQDYELYSPLVRKGGIIALHDIALSTDPAKARFGVAKLWQKIKMDRAFEAMLAEPETRGIGFIRV